MRELIAGRRRGRAPAVRAPEGRWPRSSWSDLDAALWRTRGARTGSRSRCSPGQTLVVLGPNGAGKTTLLRVLATLLRPHAGKVRVLGTSCPAKPGRSAGRVGLLGHEPLLYRELTARENLSFHARLHEVGTERVASCWRRWAMAERADEPLRRSRGGWSSGWRPRAPCCTTPSCCCWTSRAPTWTLRGRSSWSH